MKPTPRKPHIPRSVVVISQSGSTSASPGEVLDNELPEAPLKRKEKRPPTGRR